MTECDFILDQYELHGVEYVDSLLDDGYVPQYIAGRGWRWLLVKEESSVVSSLAR